MSDEVRSEEKQPLPERVKSPKPTKETWLKARVDYETGNYEGMRELAAKYGIDYKKLRDKAFHDEWIEFKATTSGIIRQKIEEKAVSKVEKLFSALEVKAERYEKMIVASQMQAAQTQDAIPVLDPEQIDVYSRVESRILDWQKLAVGINDKVHLNADVTVNVLGVLQQVRAMQDKPEVKDRVIDIEYLKECSKNLV